jgi:aryl carrier-like protein
MTLALHNTPNLRPARSNAAADEMANNIMELAASYIPNIDKHAPLAAQGLDSLSAMELRHKIHEVTGMELMTLIEDPEGASLAMILEELGQARAAARQPPPTLTPDRHRFRSEQSHIAPSHPLWISPAPFSVKMRIFCLPYAGGVSENVFARCDDVP